MMGRRGPTPVPTQLKIARGMRKRLNHGEPQPIKAAKPPKPPKWMPKDGQEEWDKIVGELHRLGLVTLIDETGLAAYCEAYVRWRKAIREMEQGGVLDEVRGQRLKSGAASLAAEASRDMHKWAIEFGFTPASRSRVKVPKPKAEAKGAERFYIDKGA